MNNRRYINPWDYTPHSAEDLAWEEAHYATQRTYNHRIGVLANMMIALIKEKDEQLHGFGPHYGPREDIECVHDQLREAFPPAPSGYQKRPLRQGLRMRVFERDGFRCCLCGAQKNLSVDHIHPERLGGTDDMENLQALCRSCNSRKRDRV